MLKILRDRFIGLGRDEDGAALVLTLGFFMFIYVLFLGIWAVGTNVRTRIHLQNACDAAAYSAAVVQADTLSRIATINRAMSWTYVQMTKRQMDYIVYKWLSEACSHHLTDEKKAQGFAFNGNGTLPPNFCGDHSGCPSGWDITDIQLNGDKKKTYGREGINRKLTGEFPRWMNRYAASFYAGSPSLEGLGVQIDNDLRAIKEMSDAEEELATKLPGRVDDAAGKVLEANVGSDILAQGCRHHVQQSQSPLDGADSYLMALKNVERDEKRFVGFGSPAYWEHFRNGGKLNDSLIFNVGSGQNEWFTREGSGGIHRSFRFGCELLKAEWSWYATHWRCGWLHGIHWACPDGWATTCPHGHNKCQCVLSPRRAVESCLIDKEIWRRGRFIGLASRSYVTRQWIDATCYADNSNSRDNRYEGIVDNEKVFASPLVMTPAYFGPAGTITVGLVAENKNPWSWLGDMSRGIFSAFEPFVSTTFCVASAKAGYRNFKAGASFGRDYRIDWREGDAARDPDDEENWNLYTSDWDAVMVPVPQAASKAVADKKKPGEAVWEDSGNVGVLEKVAAALMEHLSLADFTAGGTRVMKEEFARRNVAGAYHWDQYLDLQEGDSHYEQRGRAVRARWEIGRPGARIESWGRLQERMWH